ncbi:ABC transporter ATP-binding protein [Streptomyces sp. NPDC005248]|uniref:ABC transporter ATP-binding protein n=1 Tax=unclassified Streptomyces TaxID=2593676 RepID=UPI0033AC66A0
MTTEKNEAAESERPSLRGGWDTAMLLFRDDPGRSTAAALILAGGALAAPLSGLALASLVDGVVAGRTDAAILAATFAAILAVVQMTSEHFASMYFGIAGDFAHARLHARMVRGVQGTATLARQEDPKFADRLALHRDEIGSLTYIVLGLVQTLCTLVQMVITVALLGRLHPLLALLPLAALAPYYAGRWATALQDRAKRHHAEDQRRAIALLELAQQPGPMLEIRLAGLSGELQRRQRDLLTAVSRGLLRAEAKGALARTAGQLVFAAGYAAALILVVRDAVAGHASAGDVVLAIVLARQVAAGITQILSLTWALQQAGRVGARMHRLLADAAEDAAGDTGRLPAPRALREGIRLRGVDFCYPGSEAEILRGIDLTLPAGTVVALVGENGAGKSTLVKLLCGLYRPSSGLITVDGTDLAELSAESWRERISAAFQDFGRFEFPLQQTVGIGDLSRIDDPEAVHSALRAAGAEDLPEQLPGGLDTPIGSSLPEGRELSGGQWQKLALGRAMMRPEPVLLVLDEPTAALDAAAEHLLFERQLARARETARATGAITLFVSHRFSTVSMADRIVVLDGGAVTEEGTHAELMAAGGGYAELFALQARGYQDADVSR